jgi:formylaminopyrimidine deformylase
MSVPEETSDASELRDVVDQLTPLVIPRLQEYVQHRSINPDRALAHEAGTTDVTQRWLADVLSATGAFSTVEVIGPPEGLAVCATLDGTGDSGYRSLAINGHTDVVPVTEAEYAEWVGGDPWSGEARDGWLYGRGVSDMKGGNIAALIALLALRAAGRVPPGAIRLSYVVGEESGRKDLGPEQVLANGYGADLMVIPEPSSCVVCPAGVGWFFFRIDVQGEAGHAAGRGRSIHPNATGRAGVNAIELLAKLSSAISYLEGQWGLYATYPGLDPGTPGINPVWLSGGALQATTPDRAAGAWAVTIPPGRTAVSAFEEIRRTVEAVAGADYWLRDHPPTFTFPYLHDAFESYVVAENAFVAAARDALGGPETSPLGVMPTPSDANLYSMLGQPCVVFGPGDLLGSGVHGLDERISIESIRKAAVAIAAGAAAWCSQRRG